MTDRIIDGVTPGRIETPADVDQVADIVREADASGGWVLPVGGGTAMAGANPVDTVPIALDLTGVNGIIEYTPADMTVSVWAGTPWAELQAALAEDAQAVPHELVVVGDVARGQAQLGYAGGLGEGDPDFRDEDALEIHGDHHGELAHARSSMLQ